jgi:hypothetical protein
MFFHRKHFPRAAAPTAAFFHKMGCAAHGFSGARGYNGREVF